MVEMVKKIKDTESANCRKKSKRSTERDVIFVSQDDNDVLAQIHIGY